MALIPKRRSRHEWESSQAVISLAGVRPLVQAVVTVTASDNDDYTVDDPTSAGLVKRVILYHNSGGNTDIRVALNETADATKMPIASNVYFAIEVEDEDVISLFNTTGSDIDVNVMEIG